MLGRSRALADLTQGASSGHDILRSMSGVLLSRTKAAVQSLATPPASAESDLPLPNPLCGTWMTTVVIEDHLITAYFQGYNSYYPVVHEATFRGQHGGRRHIHPTSTWYLLYYAVLALGEWVSGICTEDHYSLYYEAARSRLRPAILESGTINSVQAFLLLGNYLQKRDRPNTGYHYIGIAVRMAMGLGLHRELPSTSSATLLERHSRRTLFWLLFCFDCWFNITTGRPALLSDTLCNVPIPANASENALLSSSALEITEAPYPTVYSITIALARLTKIANRIYGQFMCASLTADTISHQTTVMEQMLHDWHAALPSYFHDSDQPVWFMTSRKIVLWKKSNLMILLFLSSQKHHKDEYEKSAIGNKCRDTAAAAIMDIWSFCEQNGEQLHRGLSWYAVYFIVQATLSISTQYLNKLLPATHRSAEQWPLFDELMTRVLQCLKKLSPRVHAAVRFKDVVLHLRERVHQIINPGEQQTSTQKLQVAQAFVDSRPPEAGETRSPLPNEARSTGREPQPYLHAQAGRTYGIMTDSLDNEFANISQPMLPDQVLAEWQSAADFSLDDLLSGFDGWDSIAL
jgi:transcriptional regulatory protein GAL4